MGRSTEAINELVIADKCVQLTNITKVLWPSRGIRKIDFLNYLSVVSPYMLPYLKDRLLTTIRFPDGVQKEKFYQKNCPDYAPDFVQSFHEDDTDFIICQDQATLLWLGNQSAIEYHIPFSTIHSNKPSEIVFDLDPPSRRDFKLAVEAAFLLKEVFNKLHLKSFVKTSGNKGLQIYIPLPDDTFTYEDTRVFTAFVAQYLVEKEPNWFTTERLKSKRGNRLYVDYIQHAEGKTIVAPYSLRGNDDALAATPLQWDEVNEKLHPDAFPMESIERRLEEKGCPFRKEFFEAKRSQPLKVVLDHLRLT
ncbi:non-homologous end-joining DNA ligase [Schinkia sp. CFF1]